MKDVDVMEELVTKLQAFHISARLERLSHQEYLCLEPIVIEATKTTPLYSLGPSIGGRSSPSCLPGDRPCWKPPILDYSLVRGSDQSSKEMNKREGSKGLAWRTETMDNIIEDALLRTYFYEYLSTKSVPSIVELSSTEEPATGPSEGLLWQGLRAAAWDDIHDLNVKGKTLGRNKEREIVIMPSC